jgi:hypothetical protein
VLLEFILFLEMVVDAETAGPPAAATDCTARPGFALAAIYLRPLLEITDTMVF